MDSREKRDSRVIIAKRPRLNVGGTQWLAIR